MEPLQPACLYIKKMCMSIICNLYRVALKNQIEIILAYFIKLNLSNGEIKLTEIIKTTSKNN